MKAAYFDCFAGASGDMILGALIDAGCDLNALKDECAKIPLSGYRISADRVKRAGIAGTSFMVTVDEGHPRRGLSEILGLIESSRLESDIKKHATAIFRDLAAAEAAVHGVSIDQVHFHEIGAVDSIIDVVGACAALSIMGIKTVRASAVNTGGGFVETAHGLIPVPSPAAAEILKGVPVYSNGTQAELITPTGAAILTHFAESFGPLPAMRADRVGYGAGTRDLSIPNMLRVFIYEEDSRMERDRVVVLESAVDDMNPEWCQYLEERLRAAGALDVFFAPITMKKSRPAFQITVIAKPGVRDSLSDILFAESTSAGIRVSECERVVLERDTISVATRFGEVSVKILRRGGEVVTISPEYEDCAKIARARGVSLKEVYDAAKAAGQSLKG